MAQLRQLAWAIQWLACVVLAKTILAVFSNYSDYFPPNFSAAFLLGRETHFAGAYAVAFYVHIVSGPLSLMLVPLLLSPTIRQRFPGWHRRLGKLQVVLVTLLVAPSGLWMARYAMTGSVAAVAFALLAVLTGLTAGLGWQAAQQRRWRQHERWMQRCAALLSSAIVLRFLGGLSDWLNWDETYPASAWLSWLVPLTALELWYWRLRWARAAPRGAPLGAK